MPNKIYQIPENALWFVPDLAAQAEDATFEVDGLADGAGHMSEWLDLGTTAHAGRYAWRAFCQLQATTPVLDAVVNVYLKTSHSATLSDNDDGTADAVVSSINKLKNLLYLGAIRVDEAAANIPLSKSGIVEIAHRYVQVVFWNESGASLTTDVDENGFALIPMPWEVQ